MFDKKKGAAFSQKNWSSILVVSKANLVYTVNTIQNTSLVAPGELAHRLQRRIACKMADWVWKKVDP